MVQIIGLCLISVQNRDTPKSTNIKDNFDSLPFQTGLRRKPLVCAIKHINWNRVKWGISRTEFLKKTLRLFIRSRSSFFDHFLITKKLEVIIQTYLTWQSFSLIIGNVWWATIVYGIETKTSNLMYTYSFITTLNWYATRWRFVFKYLRFPL